jgi:hypothetical protein
MYSIWHRRLINNATIDAYRRMAEADQEHPLVYHLFGRLDSPESLVLTQNDYLDYLSWARNPTAQIPMPDQILAALHNHALLFLGFGVNDWTFRVMGRSLGNFDFHYKRSLTIIQVNPNDPALQSEIDRQNAINSLEGDGFKIYWGSPEEFMGEVERQMKFNQLG